MATMGRPRKLKQCPACATTDVYAFAENSARRDKLQVYCRECMRYEYFISKLATVLVKS